MKRVIFIIFGIIVLFFAGVYLLYQPSEEFFPKQTVVNGVDVSDLKIADAEKSWRIRGAGMTLTSGIKAKSTKFR